MSRRVSLLAGSAATALLATGVAACGASAGSTASSSPTAASAATSAPTAGSASSSSAASGASASGASASSSAVKLAVTISGGKVSPNDQTVQVSKGQTVSVVVTSDVATEVHVHGYDYEIEATAGKTVTKTFVADQAGSFEIETHDPARTVYELQVR